MTEYNIDEFTFHNDCVSEFQNQLLSDIFTKEHITSKQKSIKLVDEKYYGYFLEKGHKMYFMESDYLEQLPFKVTETVQTDYKSDVFEVITDADPITIPAELRMSFRDLVNKTPAFKHTNPLHFTLYKIVSMASYVDRLNARVVTDAGFGKDSLIGIISGLVNSTANIYGATFAKLEFVLTNKLIVLNELGNLKKDEKINMQEYLLAVGAFLNNYNKRTRKTETTQETYDISKTSLLIFYNLPEFYISRGQEYFDQLFTPAVQDRFIPFLFDGRLSTEFGTPIDVKGIVEEKNAFFKDVIATINYFKINNVVDIKYKINNKLIKFPEKVFRYKRSFNVILKYISEYAINQEEFDTLSVELFKCYSNYIKLIEK